MSDEPGYQEAIEEVESIVEGLEREDIDVDVLTDKVKRAACLIKYCKDKLRKTDEEVRLVLREFEKDEKEGNKD